MKRTIAAILTLVMVISITLTVSAGWWHTCADGVDRFADHYINMGIGVPDMVVDNVIMEIDPGRGTTARVVNGRTLIPIRAVVEAMDGYLVWEPDTQKIMMSHGDTIVEMWIGGYNMYVDGVRETLDVAPVVINDRTMIPVRFVAEAFGAYVDWNELQQSVTILFDDFQFGGVEDWEGGVG